MIDSPGGPRAPLTPQLALRVAVVGGVALALFAIIFFRLWFLQVLSGNTYLAQASQNQSRTLEVPAPRGQVLDRAGKILVDSTIGTQVELAPQEMPVPLITVGAYLHPPKRDMAVYRKLDRVLGMSPKPGPCNNVYLATTTLRAEGITGKHPRLAALPCIVAQQLAQLPFGNVTLKNSVSYSQGSYINERQNQFPGIQVQPAYVRNYPRGELAAQLFGTIGRISCLKPKDPNNCETLQHHFKGVSQNAVVGQSGLEYQYDKFLRGTPGSETVQVNSLGQSTRHVTTTQPSAGQDLKLSLDQGVQRAGQGALQQSISNNYPSNGGAFIAMNPQNGEIYGMGSLPTFNPSIFTKPISTAAFHQLNSTASNYPLLNRAIQSAGPTGSTFKMITGTAALESGKWSPDQSYDDTGQFCEGVGLCLKNSGGAAYGVVNLISAIQVSDDIFFYNLGRLLNTDPYRYPNGGALQQWARDYGIGRTTGIDLPSEVTGTLPSPNYRRKRNELEAQCDNATGSFKGYPKHAPGGCGIADGTNRSWSLGDNVNLAVGQGDVQVTPLQLAVAYSTLANGGTVVTPHVGLDVQSSNGTVLQKFQPPPRRHIDINPGYRQTIMAGLRAAASTAQGTSGSVFGNFPEQVYGKTGTAQHFSLAGVEDDTAWYACFVPASATSKPITVVVTVQKGGFGAVGAAPVAREILSQWFFGKPGKFVAGSSKTL